MHALSKFFLIIFWLKQNLQASNILLNMEFEYVPTVRGLIWVLASFLLFYLEHLNPNGQNRRNALQGAEVNSHRTKNDLHSWIYLRK